MPEIASPNSNTTGDGTPLSATKIYRFGIDKGGRGGDSEALVLDDRHLWTADCGFERGASTD